MEDKEKQGEFHPAVKLMLARMDSHPDEFTHPNNPWGNIYQSSSEFWTVDERQAYKEKLRGIKMQQTHERIMQTLLNQDDTDDDGVVRYATNTRYNMVDLELAMTKQQIQSSAELAEAMRVHNKNFNSPREASTIGKMLKKVFK